MNKPKTILVAPLNWGLGHATRSIPIIHALLTEGFQVIIGSDGPALQLLQKEFPQLEFLEFPSYKIEYAKNGKRFKWKMLLRSPKVLKAIRQERELLKKLVKDKKIDAVISDNRLGLYHNDIPTVFVTHQLQVLSGSTTRLTSAMHRNYIKRFDECWVPDFSGKTNLSGKLGHPKKFEIPVKYIGALSRLESVETESHYDIMVLLSGPEPQRTELEELLMHELKHYKGQVLFVRGVIEEQQTVTRKEQIKIVNFMETEDLQKAICSSDLIISRSGYTTVMDLYKLGKKAFFIPTPGQTEQEYLAKRLQNKGIIPFKEQENFSLKALSKAKVYSGFKPLLNEGSFNSTGFGELFGLFKSERKFRSHSKVAFNINLFIMGFNNMLDDREPKA
ncbi:conserved hypothetical protein [Leeuwenhoekiella marinoflava DSM 3653]|uniref:Glycosyl transferase family 28 C-terminal domain-containing protein n=2 Tax=Leeuwenhoekiella marinoflava TaxID=988 RepID=A0A4Q0PRJ6_9FLAO|nr:putative protein (TIGR00661 family) [Leeuwenhoekiella marinoflava]SHE45078.1 conserved hypothetical protein [Leeuwenhoekiella marinoflava DSM 3653]